MLKKLLFIFPLVISANVFAQEEAEDSDVEEVVLLARKSREQKLQEPFL